MEETKRQPSSSSPTTNDDKPSLLSWDAFTLEYEARVEPFTSQFAQEMIRQLLLFSDDDDDDPSTKKGEGKKKKKKLLLDVGCGTGAASLIALSSQCDDQLLLLDVAVTDNSPSMVRRAEQRIVDYCRASSKESSSSSSSSSSLLAAEVCDGEALPEHWTDAFDYAVANFSVMFFPDPVAGLREMRRCLVPATGTAAFAAWGDYGEETEAFRIFPEAAAEICPGLVVESKSNKPPSKVVGSVETLTTLMEEAGFVDVKVMGPVTKTLEVSSPLEYYNRFALTSPLNVEMISKMDDDTKVRFKDRVMHLAKMRGGREDGSVALTSSAYIAYGRKG